MGVYRRLQRKFKSKKVAQKGFEFESISFNDFSNERFSIRPSIQKKWIYSYIIVTNRLMGKIRLLRLEMIN